MRETPESTSKEKLENRALELSYQEAWEEADVTQPVQIRDLHNAHKLL